MEENQIRNNGFIINVNKPVGKTSFSVVSYIKKLTGIKKVGHAGTLDPAAQGVLLIVVGKATKQVERLMTLDKEYRATIQLGVISDTYDNTGTTLETHSTENVTQQIVQDSLKQFTGEIEQVPPPFSALKYKGKPLYKYARRGEIILPESRKVTVYDIQLELFNNPKAIMRIVCSRGTYIRSIVHDLGKKLGCGAIITDLIRLRIGDYVISDAVMWEQLPETIKLIAPI